MSSQPPIADDQMAEMDFIPSREFWAKTIGDQPGISVRDHCLNVGCVAEVLLKALPQAVRELLPDGAATLAALHDVGKISPGFQSKCDIWKLDPNNQPFLAGVTGAEPNHARVSQLHLHALHGGILQHIAEAIGAHHGRIQPTDPPGEIGGKPWREARDALVTEMCSLLGEMPICDINDADDDMREARKWLFAGLVSVADWIGSDEDTFSPKPEEQLPDDKRTARAARRIEKLAIGQVRVKERKYLESGDHHLSGFTYVFREALKGRSPRALQEAIIKLAEPRAGIYVIEDTMGNGKTEAALWLAYRLMASGKASGLYFGLPTRVTSDRIHRRVRAFVKEVWPDADKPGVELPLIHGLSWLREMPSIRATCRKYDGEKEDDPLGLAREIRRWFAWNRKAILAPFGVGTVDQALLGIIRAKWFFVRQFALAGKVVVLDEVHSYDVYTGSLIVALVKRLRTLHATPIILSATLTGALRAQLLGEPAQSSNAAAAPYPLLTIRDGDVASRPVDITPKPVEKTVVVERLVVRDFEEESIQPVIELACRLAGEKKCVLWIRNTVCHAQDAYRLLNGSKHDRKFTTGLLHSRYPAYQRASYPKEPMEALEKHGFHEERWLWLLGKPEAPRVCMRPTEGCVLVATQVVEQSVDIDADVLITDIAPTDMLLQRLGRMHRHERGKRGQPMVYLVVPEVVAERAFTAAKKDIAEGFGGVGRVYQPYVLLRTWEQWSQPQRRHLSLPRDIRPLLEDTYAEKAQEPSDAWEKFKLALLTKRARLADLALSAQNQYLELKPDEEGIGTRHVEQQQMQLLIVQGIGRCDKQGSPAEIKLLCGNDLTNGQYQGFNLNAARALHRNCANIPAWWFPFKIRTKLPPALAQYFSGAVAMAIKQGGGDELVLCIDDNQLGKASLPVICYHREYGLWLKEAPDAALLPQPEADESWLYDDDL